jgi:DNA-binding NtrC family response regulator
MRAIVDSAAPAPAIVGISPPMQVLRSRLPKAAQAERTTLIVGPTGSGKELVARALHGQSRRCLAPFVTVNCGSLPDSLIESELFGHCRGAFTGATDVRAGLVPSADGGTLFLDEINSLPMPAQTALLRFLENGEFRPVGADRADRADSWVIAASNQDLHQCVRAGTFRDDLLYRLEVVRIDVPPLALRGSDVHLLAERFLEELGAGDLRLSERARAALLRHDWPGNIRELKHRVQNAAIFCESVEIEPEDLRLAGAVPMTDPPAEPVRPAGELDQELWTLIESGMTLAQAIELCEQKLILGALRAEENNRTRAASRLGIHVRTIFKKLSG